MPLLSRKQIIRELKRRCPAASQVEKGRVRKGQLTMSAINAFYGNQHNHANISFMVSGHREISDTWQMRFSQVFYWWDKGELVMRGTELVRIPPPEIPPVQRATAQRIWIDFDKAALRFD